MSDLQTHERRRFGMSSTRWGMLGAGGVVFALLAWHWFPESHGATPPGANDGKGPQIVPVEVMPTTRADVPVYLEGLGTVQAFYTVTITPRVDGTLQKVDFAEGQTVKQGAPLAQIDPRPYQAALDQANATKLKDAAQRASAQRDLQRDLELAPNDLASKQTVDDQRALVAQLDAQVRVDQAAIDNARTQLEYTNIVSPIEGRTGIRLIDPGNNVHASDTGGIVVVTQVQPISVIFTLPEETLPAMNAALAAGPVNVAALSRDQKTQLDQGVVTLLDNQIDATTGTIRVKATFANARNTLWPGEFVNAKVLTRIEKNALTIPSSAVLRGAGGMFTYVLKPDSTVEARPLQITGDDGQRTVVASGLQAGERVVVSNQYRLQPGARVQVSSSRAT